MAAEDEILNYGPPLPDSMKQPASGGVAASFARAAAAQAAAQAAQKSVKQAAPKAAKDEVLNYGPPLSAMQQQAGGGALSPSGPDAPKKWLVWGLLGVAAAAMGAGGYLLLRRRR